jgi:NADH-quinone oxidoreductase subunit D
MSEVKDSTIDSDIAGDGGVTSELDLDQDYREHLEVRNKPHTMVLNMGPQHPSTHGVLRLLLELDGETILKAAPDIGYLHTGIEKEFEAKTYQQGVTLTDRIDYLAPLSNNLVYCLAAEKLLALEIPEHAQWMRVMLAEFTRLNSHLVWLGTHAIDIGAMSVFLYCFREREDILRVFEMFSGQRMMTSYFRIGGLALPAPRGWQHRVKAFVDIFPSRIDEYEDLLTKNHIWTGRTKGIGYISLDDMLDLGVTGPMLRAAGLKIDVRKDAPYSSYEKFDFEVPVRTENDVFARYQLRIEEMRQSCRIIKQALEGMPSGSHQADAPGIVLPDREKMKTQMEALIYHFKIVTEGFRVPAGEVYQAIESPRGEVGCYMVSDGTQKPYRIHWRGPSFANLQAIPKMVEGTLIADVIAALGSMDFVLGDTDR